MNTRNTTASGKSRSGAIIGRALAAALATAALAGCTTQVSGTASPSADLLSGPTPVPASSLAPMLAPSTTAARIVGADHLKVTDSASEMLAGTPYLAQQRCLGPWFPVQAPAYRSSGYTGVEVRSLDDSTSDALGSNDHGVIQAVVAFPAAADARTYLEDATETWRECGSQTVTYQRPGNPEQRWDLGAAKTTDNTVSMTQTPQGGRGWMCDRAMQVENNIVIDTMVCATRSAGQALDLAGAIAKNLPTLP
ncbi:MAG: sensor domain-containing protein [Actinomycetia bacterium]|nr:sensor domain-containing protein [Actinomycetes bacterium]